MCNTWRAPNIFIIIHIYVTCPCPYCIYHNLYIYITVVLGAQLRCTLDNSIQLRTIYIYLEAQAIIDRSTFLFSSDFHLPLFLVVESDAREVVKLINNCLEDSTEGVLSLCFVLGFVIGFAHCVAQFANGFANSYGFWISFISKDVRWSWVSDFLSWVLYVICGIFWFICPIEGGPL